MARLRLVAFVAALALISSAFLPLAHGATGHVSDCSVCSSISHGGAAVADLAPALGLPAVSTWPALDSLEPAQTTPWRGFDVRSARAPPVDSLTA